MFAAALISFREVVEATLIVVTIYGALIRLKQNHLLKIVPWGTFFAVIVSIVLLAIGSFSGLKVQEIYAGEIEELIEGILMLISAAFVSWAVFFLHTTFSRNKVELIEKINKTTLAGQKSTVFFLVFTAVLREGFEIVLFLSTMYLSSDPQKIFSGFLVGLFFGLLFCYLVFKTTIKLPIYYAFRVSSILLVLLAAGLFARGLHEFMELGVIPEILEITFSFLPDKTTFVGSLIKVIFGITKHMDILQILVYSLYIAFMSWWVKVNSQENSK